MLVTTSARRCAPSPQRARIPHLVNEAVVTALAHSGGVFTQVRVNALLHLEEHNPDELVLAASRFGTTALMCASDNGHVPCVDALLKHSPKEQVLAADERGRTALMWACLQGHAPCMDALLRHCPKEQVLAADKRGMTALTMACTQGHVPCIDALLKHCPKEQALDALKLLDRASGSRGQRSLSLAATAT